MTLQKRDELQRTLNDHGLTVLFTRDYDDIKRQLARLAQFERLMISAAAGNPDVEFAVDHVAKQQSAGEAA
ncbi:MAG TPA: hypothetical protein HPP94_08725 [Desulfuromonadales bacterium]|nr:hypothetical protein [Desulfuromonadales bacterium]